MVCKREQQQCQQNDAHIDVIEKFKTQIMEQMFYKY